MDAFTNNSKMLKYGLLSSHFNISHFVTTRHGGCSHGEYASFNCTPYTGDEFTDVVRNQELLCNDLDINLNALVIPQQIHSTNVLTIDHTFHSLTSEQKEKLLYGIDALITTEKALCICVSTADCVPLLLYDPVNKVIATIHAGWRGTVGGIINNTLNKMVSQYNSTPSTIIACIGPSISEKHFEVGNEVWEQFHQAGFDMQVISSFNKESGKWHINLWKANREQLLRAGVDAVNIEIAGICSFENQADFFSARRDGINSGRTLSGIMLREFNESK